MCWVVLSEAIGSAHTYFGTGDGRLRKGNGWCGIVYANISGVNSFWGVVDANIRDARGWWGFVGDMIISDNRIIIGNEELLSLLSLPAEWQNGHGI
jgi:hypothetical protein